MRTTRAGATPLYVASHEGHLEAVKVLLDVGKADVNVSTSRSGRTPLHAAAAQGHLDVVRCLIEAGADPCMASSPSGQTPLISACSAGQAAVAQYLMSQGANVNAARANGVTALYVSAYGGFGDLVRVLLQQGADPNRAAYGGDETPLHVAVRKAHLDVVQALKEYGENLEVNPRTRDGNTPLHFAARHGSPSVVLEMLTLDGVDINAKSDDGSTPLHAAACTGSLEMVSSFLARGADANRPRHTDLLTPVGCAAHFGWGDVVKELAVRGGATTFNLDRSANWSRREATSACIQELLRVSQRESSQVCGSQLLCAFPPFAPTLSILIPLYLGSPLTLMFDVLLLVPAPIPPLLSAVCVRRPSLGAHAALVPRHISQQARACASQEAGMDHSLVPSAPQGRL